MTKRIVAPAAFREGAARAQMSPGILSGGFLFLTGVTGSDAEGGMPVEPEAQFRAAFEKIQLVLEEAGLALDALVEMTSYHVGLRTHFDCFDAVRLELLTAPFPAWTAVEVAGLRRPGALVEIRAIARADPD
ncbi:MAG: RidA family protein [Pseudomonadota bacterium]